MQGKNPYRDRFEIGSEDYKSNSNYADALIEIVARRPIAFLIDESTNTLKDLVDKLNLCKNSGIPIVLNSNSLDECLKQSSSGDIRERRKSSEKLNLLLEELNRVVSRNRKWHAYKAKNTAYISMLSTDMQQYLIDEKYQKTTQGEIRDNSNVNPNVVVVLPEYSLKKTTLKPQEQQPTKITRERFLPLNDRTPNPFGTIGPRKKLAGEVPNHNPSNFAAQIAQRPVQQSKSSAISSAVSVANPNNGNSRYSTKTSSEDLADSTVKCNMDKGIEERSQAA